MQTAFGICNFIIVRFSIPSAILGYCYLVAIKKTARKILSGLTHGEEVAFWQKIYFAEERISRAISLAKCSPCAASFTLINRHSQIYYYTLESEYTSPSPVYLYI